MESLEKRRRQVETGGEQQRRLVWRHSGKDGRQSCREQRLRCWGRKRKSKEEVHGSRHSGCEGRYRVKGTAELWIWDAILVPVSLHFYCSKCCSSFFSSDGWLTASTHFQWAACSWGRRLISLPPENAGFTFGIRRRIQTFTLVFLSLVWAWSVCIYTIWQFKYANLNPYEARQREMFTVCKKIKSRKLLHWRTMKTSDPVQPIIISHWITAVSASATSAFNNFNLCLSWFHWETLQFYLLILTVCTIWQLHLRLKAVRAHHRLLHTHTSKSAQMTMFYVEDCHQNSNNFLHKWWNVIFNLIWPPCSASVYNATIGNMHFVSLISQQIQIRNRRWVCEWVSGWIDGKEKYCKCIEWTRYVANSESIDLQLNWGIDGLSCSSYSSGSFCVVLLVVLGSLFFVFHSQSHPINLPFSNNPWKNNNWKLIFMSVNWGSI